MSLSRKLIHLFALLGENLESIDNIGVIEAKTMIGKAYCIPLVFASV